MATRRTQLISERSKKYLEEALFRRLFRGGSAEVPVRQELNTFLRSRKRVYKWEVVYTIRQLRSRKRFFPALKLAETMNKRGMNPTVSDHAIKLDLVAKAKGLSSAEEYFLNLPEQAKTYNTYGALFNCYCKEMLAEKANALMEKMEELDLTPGPMPFNSLMTLYMKMNQPEKVLGVIRRMKAKNIIPDSFSYNIWMRSLAVTKDISGVERVMEEMRRDSRVTGDWTTYSNLASIYVSVGMLPKAEIALKELEKQIEGKKNIVAHQFLLTLYGRIGNLEEVHRIWKSMRVASRNVPNISYLNMIQVLVKLKDLPGAEACFKEWELQRAAQKRSTKRKVSAYDMRLVNALMMGYIEEGKIADAKALLKSSRNQAKPNAKTWEILMNYSLKVGEIRKAARYMKEAIICKENHEKWVPGEEVVQTLMEHYEKESDVEGAEKLFELLKKADVQPGAAKFEALIRIYASTRKKAPALRQWLKMDNVVVSKEAEELLVEICGE